MPKSHPHTTPPAVQERIATLALQHPTRGCNFLSDQLALEGITVSAPSVQSILNKRGLGGRYERLLALEEQALDQQITLTPELVQLIEKANTVFAERHVESSRPGELLCQDTFYVGPFKGVGKVYLHTVAAPMAPTPSACWARASSRSGRCPCSTMTPCRSTRSTHSR